MTLTKLHTPQSPLFRGEAEALKNSNKALNHVIQFVIVLFNVYFLNAVCQITHPLPHNPSPKSLPNFCRPLIREEIEQPKT
jgi:hypothetical protein